MNKPSYALLKAFYQRRKHFSNRGKWHRLNVCYFLFYGKDNIEEYFEFLSKNKKHIK
jgi:hypothetical protein